MKNKRKKRRHKREKRKKQYCKATPLFTVTGYDLEAWKIDKNI
jgi:hypothetical protein